jgi:membrane protease YdiL (CAAX protease family)
MVFETLVSIPMGTVVLEETAFRSVLPAVVAADHGVVTATAVASALFGLWHVLPSAALVRDNALGRRVLGGSRGALARAAAFGVLFTAAAGAFLCWLRFETGSVVVPAALHWATNAVGVVAAWLLARRARDDGDLAD